MPLEPYASKLLGSLGPLNVNNWLSGADPNQKDHSALCPNGDLAVDDLPGHVEHLTRTDPHRFLPFRPEFNLYLTGDNVAVGVIVCQFDASPALVCATPTQLWGEV